MTNGRRSSTGPLEQLERVTASYAQAVGERLSPRDWAVLELVNVLRLISGDQVERLFFSALTGASRPVSRGRMLKRLVAWRVLAILPRRVGGAVRGSAGSVYALGPTGSRLLAQRQSLAGSAVRVRHVGELTDRTLRHTLMVSEMYTALTEQLGRSEAELAIFAAEPTSWWPDGLGGCLKPDAYLALDGPLGRDHWWIEADRATESLPTIRRKLDTYLSFLERGQLGPGNVMPRVLLATITPARQAALAHLVHQLPSPAEQLFGITTEQGAVPYLFSTLSQ